MIYISCSQREKKSEPDCVWENNYMSGRFPEKVKFSVPANLLHQGQDLIEKKTRILRLERGLYGLMHLTISRVQTLLTSVDL